MPRRARFCPAGYPIHVIQRGNNRQAIFTSDADLAAYTDLAKKEKQRQHTWRVLINETLDIEVLAKVRHCANTGLVLGTESFREQVHRLHN